MKEKIYYTNFSDDIALHLIPTGCKIYMSKDNPEVGQFWPQQIYDVNETGREIILRCTKGASIDDLLEAVGSNVSASETSNVKHIIEKYCADLIDKNIINICEKNGAKPHDTVKITGNKEFYYPQHMMIELTSGCNLNCPYCYRDSSPSLKDALPIDTLITKVDELASIGVRVIELTGGEPLLYNGIKEILSYCASKFWGIAIISNGTLLSSELAEVMATYKNKFLVQVDLDGPTADIHDSIRGSGSFAGAVKAINLLVKCGIKTRAVMNVLPETVDKIEATADMAKRLNVTWFGFAPVDSLGRGKNIDLNFTPDEVVNMIDKTPRNIDNKYPGFLTWKDQKEIAIQKSKEINCGAGWRSFVLGPTGIIRPCPSLSEKYIQIGNIVTSSAQDVFKNPIIPFFYGMQTPRKDKCGDCTKSLYCGYCFARAIFAQEQLAKSCTWSVDSGFSNYWQPGRQENGLEHDSGMCNKPSRLEYMPE